MKNKAKTRMPLEFEMTQVGLGDGMRSDHFSWRQTFFTHHLLTSHFFLLRHTCFTLDFIEGSTKLFENGRIYFEKSGVEDIKKTYEVIAKQIDIVSVGWATKKNRHYALSWQEAVIVVLVWPESFFRCVYKAGQSSQMSMHGKVDISSTAKKE